MALQLLVLTLTTGSVEGGAGPASVPGIGDERTLVMVGIKQLAGTYLSLRRSVAHRCSGKRVPGNCFRDNTLKMAVRICERGWRV